MSINLDEYATLITGGIATERVDCLEVLEELISAGAKHQQIDATMMEDDTISFMFATMYFRMSMDMFWWLMNKQSLVYFTLDGMRKESLAEM